MTLLATSRSKDIKISKGQKESLEVETFFIKPTYTHQLEFRLLSVLSLLSREMECLLL